MISLKTDSWEIKNIETVIFDKDGTFIDLHYFWGKMTEMRVNNVLKTFKLPDNYFQKLCLCLGYNPLTKKMLKDGITALYSRSKIIEIFRQDLINSGVETSVKKIEEIFDSVSIEFYKEIQIYTKPIDSAIDFIKKLHSMNIKIGIVTSDSIESTNLTLKNNNWEYLFGSIVGRESSEFTKESGQPTKIALQELNSKPQTTIMIGDAPMDFISAKNAGIENTILVATGQIDIENLQQISPYVVKSLDEIELYLC